MRMDPYGFELEFLSTKSKLFDTQYIYIRSGKTRYIEKAISVRDLL